MLARRVGVAIALLRYWWSDPVQLFELAAFSLLDRHVEAGRRHETQPLDLARIEGEHGSYFCASGCNRTGGVMAPMGIAKFVGTEFSNDGFASVPLEPGKPLRLMSYPSSSKKVMIGSLPIHRTMSGVVAPSPRAQWYENDPEHLWANTAPSEVNPYY